MRAVKITLIVVGSVALAIFLALWAIAFSFVLFPPHSSPGNIVTSSPVPRP